MRRPSPPAAAAGAGARGPAANPAGAVKPKAPVGVIAGNPARFYPAFAPIPDDIQLPGAALRYRLAPAELIARLRVGIRFRGIGRLFLSQLAHTLASTSTGTVSPNISYEGLLHRGFGDIAALLGRVSGAVQDQLVMDGGD